MSLQSQFIKFNDNIKLSSSKLEELRQKRDILLNKLKDDKDLSSFEKLDQGSYAMGTEVEPIDKEYDIDVGLRFNVNKDDYQDAVEIKKKIRSILKNHTEYGAEIKQPCVTVTYKKDGELAYHVDLVTYSYQNKDDKKSQLYLAKGKEFSTQENKYWEKADPIGLTDKIVGRYSGDDREQYRRIIRYLKRWKNINFSSDGNSELPGIAITLLAYELFTISYDYLEERYDDLEGLIGFIKQIKNSFTMEYDYDEEEWKYKISLNLPVEPYTNVFSKMTLIQMTNLKKKFDKLYDNLIEVQNEPDTIEQCKKLNKIFGDSFEIPEKKEESKQQRNYIPSSSASG